VRARVRVPTGMLHVISFCKPIMIFWRNQRFQYGHYVLCNQVEIYIKPVE